jgi:O-antigen ligase
MSPARFAVARRRSLPSGAVPAARVEHPLTAAAAVALLGCGLAVALGRTPTPAPATVVAGGMALLGVLALAIARYDAAVALGLLLLGVVPTTPAPPDLVFGVVLAVALVSGRFRVQRVPAVVVTLLAALIAVNLLSGLDAVDARAATQFFIITLYLAVFALWFAGYVDSRRRARLVVLAYVATAIVSALLGSLALVAPFPGHDVLLYHGAARAKALFEDPNVFGPFLIPALLLLIEETVTPRLLPGRTGLKVTGVVVLGLGVLLSYSRAGWLNLGVSLLVMLAVLALRRRGASTATGLLAVLLVLGIAGMAVVSATGSLGFLEERAAIQRYDTERFSAQRTGLDLAQNHVFGIGPGQFDVIEPISTHSTYVRVLAEQGGLGLLVLVALLGSTLILAASNAAAGRSTYGIGSATLLGGWCGLLANSFFIDTLHWRHLWLVAALIWAGAARAGR